MLDRKAVIESIFHGEQVELIKSNPAEFSAGDYVTRDGTDVHYVEELDGDLVTVVCIIAPHDDWAKPGEAEKNLARRYQKCSKHWVRFAKEEHQRLLEQYPDGWFFE